MIENYRPVANLCCVSKIFEKLIIKRISELEAINGIVSLLVCPKELKTTQLYLQCVYY